nr:hypothetical protein [uncultured Nitrososphaera sp.]
MIFDSFLEFLGIRYRQRPEEQQRRVAAKWEALNIARRTAIIREINHVATLHISEKLAVRSYYKLPSFVRVQVCIFYEVEEQYEREEGDQ